MKIVIIGAGMAGLVLAKQLAEGGVDVSVYEKMAYDNLTYDWHDDVNRQAFDHNGLPYPKNYFVKGNWTFIPPSERVEVNLHLNAESELDLSIERRPFAQQYADLAIESGAHVYFEREVESLIMDNDVVKGVVVNGEDVLCDLVVDNSGAMSKFRASLPPIMGITPMPSNEEIFVAYRGFHNKVEGVQDPRNTNKAYLKHLGQKGISWSILDPDNTVDVLIGRVGELSQSTLDEAFKALQASNPQLSDNVVRGGIRCIIPIRYPLLKMVGDGYVAIGDSAFMTIPLIGSGIENGMCAACILADVILKNDSVDKSVLWEYQVRYIKARGANHFGVDILKRWLLQAEPKDIDWLFEKSIIDENDMAGGATGQILKLSLSQMLDKATRGFARLPLLLKVSAMLNRANKAVKIGYEIPEKYNEQAIQKWIVKVQKLIY